MMPAQINVQIHIVTEIFRFQKATSQWSFAYTADKMEGENFQPTWNKVDGTQAACGTCHGLPPRGHMDADLKACNYAIKVLLTSMEKLLIRLNI